MKKYKLLNDIMLSFIINNEQRDFRIGKIEGDKCGAYLESDGITIWYIVPNTLRKESITTANIIDMALEKGIIEEIK